MHQVLLFFIIKKLFFFALEKRVNLKKARLKVAYKLSEICLRIESVHVLSYISPGRHKLPSETMTSMKICTVKARMMTKMTPIMMERVMLPRILTVNNSNSIS